MCWLAEFAALCLFSISPCSLFLSNDVCWILGFVDILGQNILAFISLVIHFRGSVIVGEVLAVLFLEIFLLGIFSHIDKRVVCDVLIRFKYLVPSCKSNVV